MSLTEKPILFNTDMVRAILENRKTATRRVVKPQPTPDETKPHQVCKNIGDGTCFYFDCPGFDGVGPYKLRYRTGDVLYVRETWLSYEQDHIIDGKKYAYKADETSESDRIRKEYGYKWHPSIHMPKEAARLFLRVTDVRVERLQEITEEQAESEGLYKGWTATERSSMATTAKQAFMWVWDSTVKPADRALYGWTANPWVWVIEFERISREEVSHV